MELTAVTDETLESFRIHLVQELGLSLKSAGNIIEGTLRAMFRDSRRTISLLPNVVNVLKTIQPLHCEPDAYVFTDDQNNPVD